MFHSSECHGRVELGSLPDEVRQRLASLPGEWLEFDPDTGTIVVRHTQPSDAPVLATAASELVRMLDEIPYDLQTQIQGGDFLIHTEATEELVRMRVQAGGAIRIQWAHPDYHGAKKRPYGDGHEIVIQPWEQRLNGSIEFMAHSAADAAQQLQDLADTYEGLYPEGDFRAEADETGRVSIELNVVNLDSRLLVDRCIELAEPRTLTGRLDVSSFGDARPEHLVRFVFEFGEVWVQHPLLWSEPSA
jgi:hypothetical protein